MYDRAMAYRHAIANRQRIPPVGKLTIVRDVQDGAVLNVGVVADTNAFDVASKYGCRPDRYVIAQSDVAYHYGAWVDVTGVVEFRQNTLE